MRLPLQIALAYAFLLVMACGTAFAVIDLTINAPTHGTTAKNQFTQFQLAPITPPLLKDEKLIITIAPRSGDPDIYIGVTGFYPAKPFSWKERTVGVGAIIITQTDANYTSANTYYITVHGFTDTQYALLAYRSQGNINLQLGQCLVAAESTPDTYTYFDYGPNTGEFTVSVTPLTGDPDLYISTAGPHATKTNQFWKKESAGFDYQVVDASNSHFKTNALYYISAYHFSPNSILSVCLWDNTTRPLLIEGMPTGMYLESAKIVYFDFTLVFNRSVHIQVTPHQQGDPDIYVSTTSLHPGPGNAQWSRRNLGQDLLTISTNDPNFKIGTYHIGIDAFSETSFDIVVWTEGDNQILQEGLQVQGSTSLAPRYYKFFHGDGGTNILVDIHVIAGIGDMFFSTTNPEPSMQKCDQSLIGIISNANFNINSTMQAPVTGWMYVGVIPYVGQPAINYTILYTTTQAIQLLEEGFGSDLNYVPANSYRYYYFQNDQVKKDIVFSVASLGGTFGPGDADVVCSVGTLPKNGVGNYMWIESTPGDDIMIIKTTDKNYRNNAIFYVGVYGYQDTYFSISVEKTNNGTELDDGVPIGGYVRVHKYTHFMYYLTNSGQLSITVNRAPNYPSSADADLFVDTKMWPTQSVSQWKAVAMGDDILTIEQAQGGWYYISVYGSSQDLGFTITASADFEWAIDGYQILDHVQAEHSRVFFVLIPVNAKMAFISLTLINGFTNLYVSTNSSIIPSSSKFDYQSSTWPGNFLWAKSTDPQWTTGGWLMSVYGLQDSDFSITYQTSYTYLQNYPILGHIPTGEQSALHYFYYVYQFSTAQKRGMTIRIRCTTGTAAVIVQKGFTFPNKTNIGQNGVYWTITSAFDTIYVNQSALTGGGEWAISVYSNHNMATTFEIEVVRDSEAILINQAQPQRYSFTSMNQYQNFEFMTGKKSTEAIIEVDSCTGTLSPTFYVSNSASNIRPNSTHNSYTSHVSEIHGYSQRLSMKLNSQHGANVFIGLNGQSGNVVSMYTSSEKDDRPTISQPILSSYSNSILSLQIPYVTAYYLPLTFTAYLREYSGTSFPSLFTACGCKSMPANQVQKFSAYLYTNDAFTLNSGSLNLQGKKKYMVSVIAEDGLGLSKLIGTVFLKGGKEIFPFGNGPSDTIVISLGLIFLILMIVIFVIAMLIKFIMNMVKGAKGVELIPFIELWRILPGLMWDGFYFMVTCGRSTTRSSTSSYSHIETKNSVNASNFGNNEIITNTSSSLNENDSYGTI
mgnify:CR=1 FL=1